MEEKEKKENNKDNFLNADLSPKIKLCVSGAAETAHCGDSSLEKAKELGKEIVLQGAVLVHGATTGFPLWSAMGAKEAGGFSVGLSPAKSSKEHTEVYKLPLKYTDIVIYTGSGYSLRNLFLTRSSDAVLVGCGRMGTLNEFTIAFEDNKPIGILEGEWETDEVIKNMIERSHRGSENIIFDTDPKALVGRIIEIVNKHQEITR